jgi:ATP-dependent RNA helicase DeaD
VSEELQSAEIVSHLGYRETPEILTSVAAAVDRGHNLALLAGEGSGKEAVFAVAVARDCDPSADVVQAIVLVPTRERGVRTAAAIYRGVRAGGLRVLAPNVGSEGRLDLPPDCGAHCLVARPSQLLPEVRTGRLPLSALRLLVVDGVADLVALDEWSSVEPILDTLAPEARKIVVSRRADGVFDDLLQRQLPRARRWPEELFGSAGEGEGVREAQVLAVGAAAPAGTRLALLEQCVRQARTRGSVRIECRDERSAATVAAALGGMGLSADEPTGTTVMVGDTTEGGAAAVAFGLPDSLAALQSELAAAERKFAIIDSAHVVQLELLARRAGWTLRHLSGVPLAEELDPLSVFRHRVHRQIERAGTEAELLVLEPLLREYGALAVAGALSSLLRLRPDATRQVKPWPDAEAASGGKGARRQAPSHRGARPAWSRIFIGVGQRDEVRAADLVGAITGETGVAGAQIGKIDIRNNFSLVEIDSQAVDDVIRRLRGTSVRGRQVAVHLDREG